MTGLWIERREFHPDAPQLHELAGDVSPPASNEVPCRSSAATPGEWSDADRLWDRFLTGGTRAPAFRLVREGSTLPRSTSTRKASIGSSQVDDLVEPNHVLEHYAGGATVVLQALQFSDHAYAKLSTNLALALDQPVQVNAYLSPPAARGLDIHFDFHDVIVVQLAGRKRWHVWKRPPRSERPLKRGPAIAQPRADELGPPLFDRVLEPGDCVVLPRGFPHAAETVHEASVHLTIGVMTVTWSRLLRSRIDDIASGTALADAATTNAPDRDAAVVALSAGLGAVDIRRAIATDVWGRQPQTRLRPRVPPQFSSEDTLAVTPGPLLWVDDRPGRHKHTLELGDRRLHFPTECAPLLACVLHSTGPFRPDDLGGDLDAESRRVVLERLAVEGVVTRA